MKDKSLKNQKSPSNSSSKKKYQRYSYALKREVVHQVQSGHRSIEQARVHFGIKGKSLIYAWIKQYGKLTFDPKKTYLMTKSPKQQIKELKEKIEILEMEKDILLDFVEICEEDGFDVKKALPEQLKKDFVNHTKKA